MTAAVIAALISAAGSVGGGLLSGRGRKETKMEKTKRKLIDDLLVGLKGGGGAFGDLFGTDEAAFQKGFVDPALSTFKNRVAPGIQQEFISSGLQRGTGLDDSLSRAGVDIDALINSEFLKFQQGGKDRQAGIIGQILGGGAGAPQQLSGGEAAGQGAAGFLSGDSFLNAIDAILKKITADPSSPDIDTQGLKRSGGLNKGFFNQ